jgi:hypothetical protein
LYTLPFLTRSLKLLARVSKLVRKTLYIKHSAAVRRTLSRIVVLECYVNTISALRRYELGDMVRIFRDFEVK